MPQFVVLRHDWPDLHWDLMLENGATLRTWRLSRPPDLVGPIEVRAIADHRLAYLTYEGPVSGNRGTVTRHLAGTYELRRDEPGRLEFVIDAAAERWLAVLTEPVGMTGERREGSEVVWFERDLPGDS
ncbi:MAG: hypothetical protein NT069_22425 [Planctomycetota bacterium]|nr:hypothetical protein [Planctomycetota bacterium]